MSKSNETITFIKDWILPILIAGIIAIFINKCLVFQVKIPSESMYPTLEVGDRLLVRRVYDADKLQRGDVVVFYLEEMDDLLIKRLIGKPGDSIVIRNGKVVVNGEVLNDEYVLNNDFYNGEYQVPDSEYFFLGDNRGNSEDSRGWSYPYIQESDIKGKAMVYLYPFNKIGKIK